MKNLFFCLALSICSAEPPANSALIIPYSYLKSTASTYSTYVSYYESFSLTYEAIGDYQMRTMMNFLAHYWRGRRDQMQDLINELERLTK